MRGLFASSRNHPAAVSVNTVAIEGPSNPMAVVGAQPPIKAKMQAAKATQYVDAFIVMNSNQSGTLYIVATPIGNLGDMAPRAVETLQTVSVIACEDTRHSKKLLDHFSIDKPCVAYHDHADKKSSYKILKRLGAGDDIALISDAGTPLISDPGYRLVSEARKQGYSVVPIPGACAAISALSVSGLTHRQFPLYRLFARQKQLPQNIIDRI